MENQQGGRNANNDPPPYKCERTRLEGVCRKFHRNPANGLYDIPPGGERVNCAECLYFFE
jgi:hypothetical protein